MVRFFSLLVAVLLAAGCGKSPTSPTPPTQGGPPVQPVAVACNQIYDVDGIYVEIRRCPPPGSVLKAGVMPLPEFQMVFRQTLVERGWFRVWASKTPIGSPENVLEPLRNGDTHPWSSLSTLTAGVANGGEDVRDFSRILGPAIPDAQKPGITYILWVFDDEIGGQWTWDGGCHSQRGLCALRQGFFEVNLGVQ